MDPKSWKNLKNALWCSVLVWASLAGGFSAFMWGAKSGAIALLGSLCLAAGFYITEQLIGIFTKVKSANPPAIIMLGAGKLGWWALLFWLSRHINQETQIPLALGMGAFLLSILTIILLRYGKPKISDTI